ncbi:MAG: Fic family protein [Pseudomonadaceae bacterium]|nr:Fic family protein [Pseudomonadaceae bacterium]
MSPSPYVILEKNHEDYQSILVRNNAWQQTFLQNSLDLSFRQQQTNLGVSIGFIQSLQTLGMANLLEAPAQYRIHRAFIHGSDHKPPHPDNIPDLMDDMVVTSDFGWRTWRATYLGAYLLWRTTWIHPYDDGNGRIARALCHYGTFRKLNSPPPPGFSLIHHITTNYPRYYAGLDHANVIRKQIFPELRHTRHPHHDLGPLEDMLVDYLELSIK